MDDTDDQPPEALGPGFRRDERKVDAVRAGLLCRCPHRGADRLFQGFLTVRPSGEACGFDLSTMETGDGPATFIMQIAGFVAAFTALYVEIAYDPPMWLHLVVWIPMVTGLAFALMRPGKGLMTALQYRNTRET